MKLLVTVTVLCLSIGAPLWAQDQSARIVGYFYDDEGQAAVLNLREIARDAGHSWRRQDNLQMPTDGYVQNRTVVRYFFPESEQLALKLAEDLGFNESVLEEANGLEWGMDPSETDYIEIWVAPER